MFACHATISRAAESSVLVLSDIHFNPLADETLRSRLVAADIDEWKSILSSGSQVFSKSGEDTNWALLKSALDRIANLSQKPSFVVITGDLFAHHLREKLEVGSVAPLSFPTFARRTALFLEREFKTALPAVPIVIALGNNDADCEDGDYSVQPRGPFLQSLLPAIADAANTQPDLLKTSWLNYGSYDIPSPALQRGRVIVLNTTLLSARYQNSCGDIAEDPGMEMLQWLTERLAAARTANQKVWLVYHIPPGIDSYASTHPRGSNPEKIVPMWKPQYEAEFESILARYPGVVQNQLAGHTHFDEFRLLGTSGAYSSFVLLNSGLSPNVGQNPAFREIKFKADGTLADFSTWFLVLSHGSGSPPSNVGWTLEYKFRSEWKLKAVDLPNLSTLYRRILHDPTLKARWESIFSVASRGGRGMTEKEFAATSCAAGNSRTADFRHCFCANVPNVAFCKN